MASLCQNKLTTHWKIFFPDGQPNLKNTVPSLICQLPSSHIKPRISENIKRVDTFQVAIRSGNMVAPKQFLLPNRAYWVKQPIPRPYLTDVDPTRQCLTEVAPRVFVTWPVKWCIFFSDKRVNNFETQVLEISRNHSNIVWSLTATRDVLHTVWIRLHVSHSRVGRLDADTLAPTRRQDICSHHGDVRPSVGTRCSTMLLPFPRY